MRASAYIFLLLLFVLAIVCITLVFTRGGNNRIPATEGMHAADGAAAEASSAIEGLQNVHGKDIPIVLISFNGAKHLREAANLRKSMQKNDATSFAQLVVAVNDKYSEAFARRFALPNFRMPEMNETGNHDTIPFNKACQRKIESILYLLRLGHSVCYTDTDIVFLGPVMQHIVQTMKSKPDYHFFAQQDGGERSGAQEQNHRMCCCGFMTFRACEASINELVAIQQEMAQQTKHDDQFFIQAAVSGGRMRPYYFSNSLFPNGFRFFTLYPKQIRFAANKPLMVHNNCIVGPDAKWARFKARGLIFLTEKEESTLTDPLP